LQSRNLLKRRLEARFIPAHPAVLPHELAELTMEMGWRSFSADLEQFLVALSDAGLAATTSG
jgi:hypothetical protein